MIALALSFLQEVPGLAHTSSIVLEEGYEIEDVLTCDISGDQVADLCIASKGAKGRRLQIHTRKSGPVPFANVPDAQLDLPADVVAYAALDALPDPGREILLFDGASVVAWRWRERDESKRFTRLFQCDLLWQLPEEGTLFHLQSCVADIDADGLEDLAIPEPGGWRVALQRRKPDGTTTFATTLLVLPDENGSLLGSIEKSTAGAEMRSERGGRHMAFGFNGGSFRVDSSADVSGPYLSIDARVPAAQLVDWDGDGDLDLLVLGSKTLRVFVQEPRGTFDPQHSIALESPVVRDRKRELDVSFAARALDLDGDGRADCVLFAGDQHSDSTRTQALVFLQKGVPKDEPPLFGAHGAPRQLLVLDGFARPLAIEDIDGDGLPDLVAGAVRPDMIDALRAAASERLDTEIYVYRNTGSGFSKRPDLTKVLSFQAGGRDVIADFIGDVTGDGVRDFLERTDRDHLRLHMVRKTRDGLTIVDKPVWELAIDPEARVLLPGQIAEHTPDLFVLDKRSVECVSFPLMFMALMQAVPSAQDSALHLVASFAPTFQVADHRVLDLDDKPGAEILVVGAAGEVRTYRWSSAPAGFDPKGAGDLVLEDPRHALLALARLSGTGPADLCVAGPRGVEVHRANASGVFTSDVVARAPRARSRIRTGEPRFAPIAQDVDGDGRMDFVVANGARLELWLQRPSSGGSDPIGFQRAASVSVPIISLRDTDMAQLSDSPASTFTIPALHLADVNGDGKRDLLVEEGDVRAFHIVKPDGTIPAEPTVKVDLSIFKDTTPEATIAPGRTLAGAEHTIFESRDLDLDGIPDYVIAHRRKVWVFHGTKDGPQFETPSSVLKTTDDVTALMTLNLDDDKRPDLLLLRVQVPSVATILRGLVSSWEIEMTAVGYRGGGEHDFETTPAWRSELSFKVPAILSILKDPDALIRRFEQAGRKLRVPAEADFDGDGKMDVALQTEDGTAIEVWRGQAAPVKRDPEENDVVLRRLLFEDDNKSWDIDRLLAFVSGFGEDRVRALTGGRPPDARFKLRDADAKDGAWRLVNVTPADVDGDGRTELVLRYDAGAGLRSVFDVVGWRAQ